ncbi:Ank protein [Pseudocowpox virus]
MDPGNMERENNNNDNNRRDDMDGVRGAAGGNAACHPHVREFKEASLYGFLTTAADVTVEDVRRYLEFGANVNYRGAYLCTPLHIYMQSGCEKSLEVVDALLEAGADLNAKEICGLTPMHMYASYAEVDVDFMRGLVERGARVGGDEAVTGCLFSYLYTLSVDGGARREVVELLVQAGADVNVCGEAHKTPLHVHCAGFEVEASIVELLLRAGADPEALDDYGLTPADVLVKSVGASVEVLRLFIDAGVSLATARDVRGRTPLHHHADSFRASAAIVHELLAAGCDAAAVDNNGNTVLHSLATFCTCRRSVVDQLIAGGADINARNQFGHSCLYYAAIYNPSVCARLIAAGADPLALTPDGRSPLAGMVLRKHTRAVLAALETRPPADGVAAALDVAMQHEPTDATRACVAYVVLCGGTLSARDRARHADLVRECELEVAVLRGTVVGLPGTSLLEIVRARTPPPVLLSPRVHHVLRQLTVYSALVDRRLREMRHKTNLVDAVVRLVCPCALPPEVVRGILVHVPVDCLRCTLCLGAARHPPEPFPFA